MHHIETLFIVHNLSDDASKDAFGGSVMRWSVLIVEAISARLPEEALSSFQKILDSAWQETRIRCQLTELMAKYSHRQDPQKASEWCKQTSTLISTIGALFLVEKSKKAVRALDSIRKDYLVPLHQITFLRSESPEVPPLDDRASWRDVPITGGIPLVIYRQRTSSLGTTIVRRHRAMTKKRIATLREELLSGQKAAFDGLRLMIKARKAGLTAGGIKPRLHGLLIGPSGSGKTHVVRTVARAEGQPIFEQSAASWMPNGSRSDRNTPRKLAEFVYSNDSGIIYLDEIEKPFPPNFSGSIAWERVCTDEIMSLLDAKVARWENWSETLAEKLDRQFFVVLSGAWQSAYLAAFRAHSLLGGDWTNLSIVDSFLEENHLPPELLNRVSTNVIEVLPPSQAELATMVMRVQHDLQVKVDAEEANQVAKEMVQERKGMRGVEEFLVKRWMRKQTSGVSSDKDCTP